eukprot:365630-Chlamydomonas_euryale.AAC.31
MAGRSRLPCFELPVRNCNSITAACAPSTCLAKATYPGASTSAQRTLITLASTATRARTATATQWPRRLPQLLPPPPAPESQAGTWASAPPCTRA